MQRPDDSTGSPGDSVPSCCQALDAGVGNHIQVLWKTASSLVTEPSLQARINTPSLEVLETESGPARAGQILCLQATAQPSSCSFPVTSRTLLTITISLVVCFFLVTSQLPNIKNLGLRHVYTYSSLSISVPSIT